MTLPPEVLAQSLADRYRLERELRAGGMAKAKWEDVARQLEELPPL